MDGLNRDADTAPPCAQEKTVPADATAMPGLVAFLEGALDSAGCPPSVSTKLMICLDEIASNVMKFSKASKLTVRTRSRTPTPTSPSRPRSGRSAAWAC